LVKATVLAFTEVTCKVLGVVGGTPVIIERTSPTEYPDPA